MEIIEYPLEPDPREVEVKSGDEEIYLSVKIGNGQIGGTNVHYNGELLAKGRFNKPILLGKAGELSLDIITVVTNVLDVNPFTNSCIITTQFENGATEKLFSKKDQGDAPENGIATFKGNYKILVPLLLLLLLHIGGIGMSRAQGLVEFQELEMPASPGFILLDQAPAAIERPTTPQGVGLSLLSYFRGNGGALETAPFWLMDHPNLTAEMMYKNKFPLLQHLMVSIAVVEAQETQYLSGGIRTRLFQSYGKQTLLLDSLKSELEEALSDPDLDLSLIKALNSRFTQTIEKPVFNIDFAAALGAGSPDNAFNTLELSRWAAWISSSWRPGADDFYFTLLARYLSNENFQDYTTPADLLDMGARFNYDISAFCISAEYLQRINMTENTNDDFRLAIIGSYKISEHIYITATFGKNFSDFNNIIALAGINFGFSKNKLRAF